MIPFRVRDPSFLEHLLDSELPDAIGRVTIPSRISIIRANDVAKEQILVDLFGDAGKTSSGGGGGRRFSKRPDLGNRKAGERDGGEGGRERKREREREREKGREGEREEEREIRERLVSTIISR